MKPLIAFVLIFLCSYSSGTAQDSHSAVKDVLHKFFYAIHQGDSSLMASTLHPDAQLLSLDEKKPNAVGPAMSALRLAKGIGRLPEAGQKEKIWKYDISIDAPIEQAWLPYCFYLKGEFHHCGTNNVQLVLTASGWKIIHLIDTREMECDYSRMEGELQQFMDDWHLAAATADGAGYFSRMATDGIYLGTDATEKWFSHELRDWSKKYFERESAWAFKATSREFYFSEDDRTVWFDEILDTWMGECRGSGVLTREHDGSWILAHYNLAMLVPNDLVQEYLKLKKE